MSEPSGEREIGTVKSYSDEQGHGFITPDSGASDIFVNFRDIQRQGYKSLKEGERVTFTVERGQERMQAREVRLAVLND